MISAMAAPFKREFPSTQKRFGSEARGRQRAAITEIVIGMIAQLTFSAIFGSGLLDTNETWVKVLSGVGVMLLTFLAGAELDPQVMKLNMEGGARGRIRELSCSILRRRHE